MERRMTLFKSLVALSIAFTISATGAIVAAQARDKPPSPPPKASAAKQNAQDAAKARGIDPDAAKAKAASVTPAQKDAAWAQAQTRIFQRINAALQKAKAECPSNAACQTKVDQAKTAFLAEVKRQAQATGQWCKSNKCMSEAVEAKATEIFYRVCPRYFNNC